MIFNDGGNHAYHYRTRRRSLMKFTCEISDEKKAYLEKEYREYVKRTPMSKDER